MMERCKIRIDEDDINVILRCLIGYKERFPNANEPRLIYDNDSFYIEADNERMYHCALYFKHNEVFRRVFYDLLKDNGYFDADAPIENFISWLDYRKDKTNDT